MARKEAAPEEVSGSKGTFVIQVKSRQNATWQGSIQWLEGKKTLHFRSALELLKMMDSALEESAEKEKNT